MGCQGVPEFSESLVSKSTWNLTLNLLLRWSLSNSHPSNSIQAHDPNNIYWEPQTVCEFAQCSSLKNLTMASLTKEEQHFELKTERFHSSGSIYSPDLNYTRLIMNCSALMC